MLKPFFPFSHLQCERNTARIEFGNSSIERYLKHYRDFFLCTILVDSLIPDSSLVHNYSQRDSKFSQNFYCYLQVVQSEVEVNNVPFVALAMVRTKRFGESCHAAIRVLCVPGNAVNVRSADVVLAVGGANGTLSEIALALKIGKPVVSYRSWELPPPPMGLSGVLERAGSSTEAVQMVLRQLRSQGVR